LPTLATNDNGPGSMPGPLDVSTTMRYGANVNGVTSTAPMTFSVPVCVRNVRN
jgi:hypothetical protein